MNLVVLSGNNKWFNIALVALIVILLIGMVVKKLQNDNQEVVYVEETLSESQLAEVSKWRTHLVNMLLQYIADLYGIEEKDYKTHFAFYEPATDKTVAIFVFSFIKIELFFDWECGVLQVQFSELVDKLFTKSLKLKLTDAGVDDIKYLKFLIKTYNYCFEDEE